MDDPVLLRLCINNGDGYAETMDGLGVPWLPLTSLDPSSGYHDSPVSSGQHLSIITNHIKPHMTLYLICAHPDIFNPWLTCQSLHKTRKSTNTNSDSSSPFHRILELVRHLVTLFNELRCVCLSCDHIMNVFFIFKAHVHWSVSYRLRRLQYNSEYPISNELDFVVGRSWIWNKTYTYICNFG